MFNAKRVLPVAGGLRKALNSATNNEKETDMFRVFWVLGTMSLMLACSADVLAKGKEAGTREVGHKEVSHKEVAHKEVAHKEVAHKETTTKSTGLTADQKTAIGAGAVTAARVVGGRLLEGSVAGAVVGSSLGIGGGIIFAPVRIGCGRGETCR